MQCPNCSSEVPPGPPCPRCGLPLPAMPNTAPISAPSVFGAPSLPQVGSAGPASVPLTVLQKARLVVDCLPLVFFVLAFVFVVTFFDAIYGAPHSPALLLFLGVVILVTGHRALQRLRDLASGVALVHDDLLERLWRPRRGSGHYGKFAQLGTLRLRQKAYSHGQPGQRHRIIYSPASKIAWLVKQLD
jgi:hypothetical protein